MTWIANHSWIVPLVLNIVLIGYAVSPLNTTGGGMSPAFVVLLMIVIWGLFVAFKVFEFFWMVTFR